MSALRTLDHTAYPPGRIAAEREVSISLCLPAQDEAGTIGPILESLLPLREAGVVDQVLVLDDSLDGTGEVARALGAEVHAQRDLRAEFGPVRGKGDALWRALAVATGDVVAFLDADSEDLGPHFACGLVGPLVCERGLELVKGFYRRPFRTGEAADPEGGGRVTELMARPLLAAFYPELAAFRQPLAGEVAARRALLERLPFACGYGVDVALLIDAWREVGLGALAQVDLRTRQNRHRPLPELSDMAAEVLHAVLRRVERDGRLIGPVEADPAAVRTEERPPAASLLGCR